MIPTYKKDMDISELLDGALSGSATIDPKTYQYFKGLARRRIVINDEIDDTLLDKAIIPFMDFDDGSDEPIEIIINTCGGSPFDVFGLADLLDKARTPTTLIAPCYTYSAGIYLLMAGFSNRFVKKICFAHATGLLHAGSSNLMGSANAVKDTQKFIEAYDERIKEYVLSHSKMTPEQYERIERSEHYMNSEEMLALGIVDEII